MIIVLMGYMGSGKSTIGSELSKILKYDFIDLDAYIEMKEAMSVSQIFKKKGEIYFRKIEMKYLKDLLKVENNLVLALGGGTPCYGNNIDIITNGENIESFYLKTSLKELSVRLMPDKSKRPLISHLNNEQDFMEFLGKHLFERSVFYSKAEKTIVTDGKSISNIVEAIVANLI